MTTRDPAPNPVSVLLENGIARIALDDGKANAINPRLLSGISAALDRAEQEQASGVVLHGRSGCLSGGLDLKTLPALPPEALREALSHFTEVMLRIFTFPRPVVVAATGHAIAGGAVLALAGDERFGADGAFRVGLNETAIGLSLPRFVVEMAERSLPASSLHRVLLTGELFDPAEARRLGLLDRVLPPADLLAEAIARAQILAQLPKAAYADNKRALRAEAAERGRAAWQGELDAFMQRFVALAR